MMTTGPIYANLNVEFEDVRYLRATAINDDQEIDLSISIHGSGQFEISESSTTVVTGIVRKMEGTSNDNLPSVNSTDPSSAQEPTVLKSKDFYKELRLRGYHYNGLFNSVEEASFDVSQAKIKWHGNWTALMDCMLQLNILAKDSRSLYLPTRIRKIRINAAKHLAMVGSLDASKDHLDASYTPELKLIKCGGIEIYEMVVNSVVRRKPAGIEVHDTYQFVPLNPVKAMNITDTLKIMTQLILENTVSTVINVLEIHNENADPIIGNFNDIISDMPLATVELALLTNSEIIMDNVKTQKGKLPTNNDKTLLTITTNGFEGSDLNCDILNSINEGCFLLNRESNGNNNLPEIPKGFACLTITSSNDESYLLLQRARAIRVERPKVIMISSADTTFQWVSALREAIKKEPVLVVAYKDQFSGVIGLVNCLRREPGGINVRCFIIDDRMAPEFSFDTPLYKNQLELGLAINIYRNGAWGTYRFLNLTQTRQEAPQTGHVYANVQRLGDLSSFQWFSGSLEYIKSANKVDIHYSSINFRDVMLATGRLPPEICSDSRLKQDCLLGLEYSGVNEAGERVMGMVAVGAMATQVESVEHLTWNVPAGMSLRDAATIPAVYVTIYYAFFLQNPIASGKSILIHAGSGGIGLAAIRVAFAYGMEVYTTVSNAEKRKFILGLFPQLIGKIHLYTY